MRAALRIVKTRFAGERRWRTHLGAAIGLPMLLRLAGPGAQSRRRLGQLLVPRHDARLGQPREPDLADIVDAVTVRWYRRRYRGDQAGQGRRPGAARAGTDGWLL